MDTKSRSIKPALAFLAFVLGVSLLLYSGSVFLYYFVFQGRNSNYSSITDAFQEDYQETEIFRSLIGSQLYALLDYATNHEEYSHIPVNESDPNLLFVVESSGQTIASNTADKLTSQESLPVGYNFLLYFDGKKVYIWKDGQEVDVYGDGYFRGTNQDWYVPGYQNSPSDSACAPIKVRMAAAEDPERYTSNYGCYSITQELAYIRMSVIWLFFVPPVAGTVLLILAILWRKYKHQADRSIAWFTGHIWLEVKLLLLIPLIYLCAYALVCCAEFFFQNYFGQPIRYLSIPAALWWCYLYLNDLRYNFGHIRTHSFCAACFRLLRRQELRFSVQQRMDRRTVIQFALCIPFFLLCAMRLPELYHRYFYYGLSPLLLAVLFLGGLALIAAQIRLMRENRRTTADIDRLLTHIQAAGEGRPTDELSLPKDSDLQDAAHSLSHMEAGLRSALELQMKSERMKVELIANVSHDLKTPLTSIISYAELLRQEEGLPQHVQDYIHILFDKARRLQVMVQDVFEVSKATTGNLTVTIEPIDYAKLLRQTLADMCEEIAAATTPLRVRLPDDPVWIEADGARMYRVFQNLIQNALKYALDGSRIYLNLDCAEGRATAVLRNISREELPQDVDLTERFVRGDPNRTDGGSGLGLSIARTFTEACGGVFSVRMEADLFTAQVSFPQAEHCPSDEPPPPSPADSLPGGYVQI